MLVICEDCAKKYNIDESRIQGARARFICKECGHIIIVNKLGLSRPPVSSPGTSHGGSTIDLVKEMQGPAAAPSVHEEKPEPSEPSASTASQQIQKEQEPPPSASTASQQIQEKQEPPPKRAQAPNTGEKEKGGGLPVSMHFIFALLYTIISTIGVLGYFYFSSSNVLNRQLDLRTNIITTSLSLVGVVAVVGVVLFLLLSRLIATPLRELTAAANRINDGEPDLPVVSRGPREVRELAAALEQVRLSCRKVRISAG